MKAPLVLLLLLTCLLAAAPPEVVRAQLLDVRLSGGSVVPPSGSTGYGDAQGYADCYYSEGSLFMDGGFGSLLSPPIAVEFHRGAADENGPLCRTISDLDGGAGGFFSFHADFTVTGGFCDSLYMELAYIVVTSQTFPNGEIRGQITRRLDATRPASWGRLKLLYR